MKKVLYSMLAFMLVLPLAFGLVACGNNEPEIAGVESAEEFLEAFAAESSVALGANITLEEKLDIDKDIEINLNGKTLTFAGDINIDTAKFIIRNNAERTVKIKNGTIVYTSEVDSELTFSCITNYGNLTLENVSLQFGNLNVATGDNRLDGIANWGEGNVVIKNSTISLTVDDTSRVYKTCGIFSLGRSLVFENSTLTLNCSANSSYGIYNYINVGEVDPGTRTATITGSTINLTGAEINSLSGVFAESYVEGEDNKAVIIIGANTVVNVTRTAESGSGKITYGLRAKGNAVITGANNATITLTDNTECTKLERGPETTGVIED